MGKRRKKKRRNRMSRNIRINMRRRRNRRMRREGGEEEKGDSEDDVDDDNNIMKEISEGYLHIFFMVRDLLTKIFSVLVMLKIVGNKSRAPNKNINTESPQCTRTDTLQLLCLLDTLNVHVTGTCNVIG